MCKKAGNKLNVLARSSKTMGSKDKMLLFHAFILFHFNYCSLVCHFSKYYKLKTCTCIMILDHHMKN